MSVYTPGQPYYTDQGIYVPMHGDGFGQYPHLIRGASIATPPTFPNRGGVAGTEIPVFRSEATTINPLWFVLGIVVLWLIASKRGA